MILANKGNRWKFVRHLFAILDKNTNKDVGKTTQPIDLVVLSWTLLLISDVVAVLNSETSVIHSGTHCGSCMRSPITGNNSIPRKFL